MASGDFKKLGFLLNRMKELHESSLFGDNETVNVVLHRGCQHLPCRIVGAYLDTSSSKEEIRIDVFLELKQRE